MDGVFNFPMHFIVKSEEDEVYYRYQAGHLGVVVDPRKKIVAEVDEDHFQSIVQDESLTMASCYPADFMSAYKYVTELLTYNVNDGAK